MFFVTLGSCNEALLLCLRYEAEARGHGPVTQVPLEHLKRKTLPKEARVLLFIAGGEQPLELIAKLRARRADVQIVILTTDGVTQQELRTQGFVVLDVPAKNQQYFAAFR